MCMPTLIDGHNLIGRMPGINLSDPDDEEQLVLMLRRYATLRRGRRVVVVFDRGTYGHPTNLNGYGVETHFARSPADADKELIRRIRAIKRGDAWQVVTSDRAVAGEARAHGIAVIGADEFARRLIALRQPRASNTIKHNDQPLSNHEIDEWMQIFGITNETEDEENG